MMVVCIAGMHRSGTSMVTRVLNLCGVYLGQEEDLVPAAPDNPEGFWENTRFVQINEAILSAFGGAWDVPPGLPADWVSSSRVKSLKEDARKLIAGFDGRPVWGWKDPRSSLTLPFWRSLLPDLKVIVVVRNPLDVFGSLASRAHSSLAFSSRLTEAYFDSLLADQGRGPWMATHYDVYFEEPRAELQRLLSFLELPASPDLVQSALSPVQQGSRHSRSTFLSAVDLGLSPNLVDAYLRLCRLAGDNFQPALEMQLREAGIDSQSNEGASNSPAVRGKAAGSGTRPQSVPSTPGVSELAARQELLITHARARIRSLEEGLEKNRADLQTLSEQRNKELNSFRTVSAQLAERSAQLAERQQAMNAMSAQLKEQQRALQDLSVQSAAKDAHIQRLTNTLTGIQQSRSWKTAQLLARVYRWFRPAPPNREGS